MAQYMMLGAMLFGLAAAGSVAAQPANFFRDAYPLCFELFQDEVSAEHKTCIDISARNPSGWSREHLQAAVRQELDRQKRAEEAQNILKGKRGDPNAIEFKGLALGLDLRTVEGTDRFACRSDSNPFGADHICTLKYGEAETIAGATVKWMSLFFYSDRLEQITISFESSDFASVREALNQKYGVGVVTAKAMQNRMGATFESQSVTWRKTKARVQVEQYAGQLENSMVTYQSDTFLHEFAKRRKSSAKKGASDL